MFRYSQLLTVVFLELGVGECFRNFLWNFSEHYPAEENFQKLEMFEKLQARTTTTY